MSVPLSHCSHFNSSIATYFNISENFLWIMLCQEVRVLWSKTTEKGNVKWKGLERWIYSLNQAANIGGKTFRRWKEQLLSPERGDVTRRVQKTASPTWLDYGT